MRKRIRGRIILLAVATLLTGYYIVPSVFPVESLPSLFPGLLPRAEKMNLGLDLQGGIHLVLEVQAEKAVENATERQRGEIRRLLEKEKIDIAQLDREGNTGIVLRVAKDLGWKIVDSNPPNLRVDGVAQIEAITRSPVFGFADDIAVRVRPLASQTRIDLRSVSRVGRQDFGANARHFARFAAAVQDALQEP